MWQQYQDWLYYHDTLEIFLDVSRMRFERGLEGTIAQMQPLFYQAFRDVAALERGTIANPDEQRLVGHYWLRNPHLAPTASIQQEIIATLGQIHDFADRVHSGSIRPPDAPRFTDLLSIGIGGSALGPQFVADALAAIDPPLAIHFIDNTDPAGIDRTLTRLKDRLASTLVLVTSKSGGTPETRNGMIEVQHVYAAHGLGFAQHAVAITGRNSSLAQLASAQGWLGTFPLPDWVGGRTSELSVVGLLPAALQGIDIDALLTGARVMDDATRVPDVKTNPAALLALCWYQAGAGRGSKAMVLLPYKDSLLLFSRYLQQLVMESLGKAKDLDGTVVQQGLTVYGNKGSTDQHAYVQQLRDGLANFFVTFIEVLDDRQGESIEVEPQITSGDYLSGLMQGTRRALWENHRDCITLTLPRVDPMTIGALIALYERSVSLYAALIHVNAYDQPGVEAGKQAAGGILALQRQILSVLNRADQPLSLYDLAAAVSRPDDRETIYTIVRHLHANHRLSVTGHWGRPDSLAIQLNFEG